jgi:hypothetical protein
MFAVVFVEDVFCAGVQLTYLLPDFLLIACPQVPAHKGLAGLFTKPFTVSVLGSSQLGSCL